MTEKIDTTSGLPKGRYIFTVSEMPEKFRTPTGKIRYAFLFGCIVKEEPEIFKQSFFPWTIKPLLKAMRIKETTPNHFEFELADLLGKQVSARIIYEQDKNKPDKEWARMVEICPVSEHTEEPLTEQDEDEENNIPF